ncbi:ATP-binding protein [Cereibacter azotoformans]|nr:ATP-binding protein [Cereibacter azotoformans]UIJ29269.1 ATP-binding protein [Cereibacter azotoformans]
MAGFPAVKTLESYDFKFATSAPKRQIEQPVALAFVARKENVVFLGPSGLGQSQVYL